MPTAVMAAPSPSSRVANIRGAVPAPNEKPRMPCRSLDAHSANTAITIMAIPPTKSCGFRTHLGMIDLTGAWPGVAFIDTPPPKAAPPACLDNLEACPGNLLATFVGQRQQNQKRFWAERQMTP